MKCRVYKKPSQPKWWDTDCEDYKQRKYHCLSIFRRTRTDEDLDIYKKSRREFKNLCREKVKNFERRETQRLADQKSSKDVWRCLKDITRGNTEHGHISTQDWYKHFETMTNGNKVDINVDFKQEISSYLSEHDDQCALCSDSDAEHYDFILNSEMSQNEVKQAIGSMKTGKASGPDGYVLEFYKYIPLNVLPLIVKLFNLILANGNVPESWCQAIICPLYKGKGSINDQNNYRGISLINVISKIFMKVLNTRLVKWSEDKCLIREEQIGYRRGFCTVDHLFSMQAVGQKYLTKRGGRLYVLYVDFSKAFDCIQHDLLWFLL